MSINQDAARERLLLEAVSGVADQLLVAATPPPVTALLQALGEAADVSRLVLVAARPGGGSTAPRMEGRQQWVAPGVARLVPGPDGWPRYPARWHAELSQGTTIAGPTRAFPAEERASLEAVGTRSALFVPVIAGDEFYGHLCCHDVRTERPWTQGEVEALRTAAAMLGGSFHARKIEAEAERRTALLRAVGQATSVLMEAGNWRQALPRVLDGLRTVCRARTAWAYGADPDHPGRRAVLLYEVLAPGARPGGGRTRVVDLPPEAPSALSTAGIVHDRRDDEPMTLVRDALGPRAGASWAVAAVVADPGALGFLGLEAEGDHAWSASELDALEIVAGALTSAIRRGATMIPVPIIPASWSQGPASGLPPTPVSAHAEAAHATDVPLLAEDGNPR